jgi:hypothetical protein
MESLENIHITRAQAYNIYIIMTITPNRRILAAKVERRVVDGTFWTQHAGKVIRKNNGAQPLADVHHLSFSLQDED